MNSKEKVFTEQVKTNLETFLRKMFYNSCKIAFTVYNVCYLSIEITDIKEWDISLYEMIKIEKEVQQHGMELVDLTFLEYEGKTRVIIVCKNDIGRSWFNHTS